MHLSKNTPLSGSGGTSDIASPQAGSLPTSLHPSIRHGLAVLSDLCKRPGQIALDSSMFDGEEVSVDISFLMRETRHKPDKQKGIIGLAVSKLLSSEEEKGIDDVNFDDDEGDFSFTDKSLADHAVYKIDQKRLCFLSVREAQPQDETDAPEIARIGSEDGLLGSSVPSSRVSTPNRLQTDFLKTRARSIPRDDELNAGMENLSTDSSRSESMSPGTRALVQELEAEFGKSDDSGNEVETGIGEKRKATEVLDEMPPLSRARTGNTQGENNAMELQVPQQTPVAASSSQSQQASAASAQPALTVDVHKTITTIVKPLLKWDQNPARSQIETKLHQLPENEHKQALLTLNVDLSSKAQTEKPQFIANWTPKSIGQLTAQSDLRTDSEKQLQDDLALQRRIPAFAQAEENIRNMLPGKIGTMERARVFAGHINHKNYYSALWRRIFADPRGPVTAIQDLENHLNGIAEAARYQAILDWPPK